jgi:Na+-driven multidrug efflux pump
MTPSLSNNSAVYHKWDNGLLFSIFLVLVLPSIYNSYSIFLIGNKPPELQSLAIVAQWQFVQVGMEVIQEGLVLPFFYLLGKMRRQQPGVIFRQLQTNGLIVLAVLLPLGILIWSITPWLIERVGTTAELQGATSHYLRIRMVALFWSILNIGLFIILESLRLRKLLVAIIIVKLLLFLAFDSLFFGGYSFSLNLGVAGVAWSQLVVEVLCFLILLVGISKHFGIPIYQQFQWPKRADWQQFQRISGWVFLESLIRNLAYLLLILRLINSIGPKEISAYYLAMHLFWSFALVPILAIADATKVMLANYHNHAPSLKRILRDALVRTAIVLGLWGIGFLFLHQIIAFFSTDSQINELAYTAMLYLAPAYFLLAINLTISSIFLGTGETRYLAYKSILTNLLVYATAWIAYQTDYWSPTFTSVLTLFGIGIIVGTGLTILYARSVLRKMEF